MKTINAFIRMKYFSERVEKINAAMKVSNSEDLLRSVKEYLFSVKSLDTSIALKALAEYLLDKYDESNNIEAREMYDAWSNVLFETSLYLEFLSDNSEEFNYLVDIALIDHKNIWSQEKFQALKRTTEDLIEGVRDDVDYFLCFRQLVHIFEKFVLPGMSKTDLCPDIDIFSLNKKAFYQC